MATNWEEITLADAPLQIIDGDRGTNYPKQSDFFHTGHCLFLNAGNVTSLGFDFSDSSFISKDKDELLRKGKAQRNDVILTTRGTVGNVALFDDSIPFNHIRINSGMVLLRPDTTKILPRFLFQFVRSSIFRRQVVALTTGSAQPQLPIRDINRITLALPSLSEQRAIAHILGTLDDKIELNRRMNETLEAMARALFKAWFVDFEPVRAKMDGRWQRGQSLPGFPAHLYDLFPDRLVESDLGEIPEGWEVRSLAQLLTVIGGGTPKTSNPEYWGEGVPWFSVVDTPRAGDAFVVETEKSITQAGLDGSSAKLIPKGTTIISARGTVGNLAIAGQAMTFNQSCYGLQGVEGIGEYFIYLIALQMVDQLKTMAHGSVFSTITRQTFETIQWSVPSSTILREFEEFVAIWFETILLNVKESRTLAQLRDTLLPKLISGQLRVNVVTTDGLEGD